MKRLIASFVKILALCAVLTVVAACSKLSPENFEKVKTGMSTAEVKAIMGAPSDIKTGDILGVGTTTWIYKSGRKSAEFNFMNDALMTKSGNF
ncbi:hypothetical protein QQ054_15895 [Oscillatoria amoena NRMC-F 0135]|nr:hypothetical protein [Oscillatoria laete-virens]MDL5047498.1 hypothetical protein [Oscillatoria amoena NRMC-F 0135]MDL5054678.1 hypothetical protein [Oscillatoria laete-virens NRMC-F 0139]